jgi:hypothetical protein
MIISDGNVVDGDFYSDSFSSYSAGVAEIFQSNELNQPAKSGNVKVITYAGPTNNAAVGSILELNRANGAYSDSMPPVLGNVLGQIDFGGTTIPSNPLNTRYGASIYSYAAESWSTSSHTANIMFKFAMPNQTGYAQVERFRFETDGSLTINGPFGSYRLPNYRGTAGQVLTDVAGDGQITWETPTGGSGGGWNLVTTTANLLWPLSGQFILVNSNNCIVTLPTPVLNARLAVKLIHASSLNCEIRTTSGNIDGVLRTTSGLHLWNQYDVLTFICDGTNWWIEA